MVRIAISSAAYEAIAATLALGSVAVEPLRAQMASSHSIAPRSMELSRSDVQGQVDRRQKLLSGRIAFPWTPRPPWTIIVASHLGRDHGRELLAAKPGARPI